MGVKKTIGDPTCDVAARSNGRRDDDAILGANERDPVQGVGDGEARVEGRGGERGQVREELPVEVIHGHEHARVAVKALQRRLSGGGEGGVQAVAGWLVEGEDELDGGGRGGKHGGERGQRQVGREEVQKGLGKGRGGKETKLGVDPWKQRNV